jgi:hypothetical protein
VSEALDRTVRVWDLVGGRCTASYPAESDEAGLAWARANGGLVSAVAREPYCLTLRDTTGETMSRFPGSFSASGCSAGGRHVVAGDSRGGVYLLRLHARPGLEGR